MQQAYILVNIPVSPHVALCRDRGELIAPFFQFGLIFQREIGLHICDPCLFQPGLPHQTGAALIAGIEDNTGKVADSVDITNEELKYLRDIAERDVINRFTTAEIKVEMTNHNNVSSDRDLDGIVDYLVVGINEAMVKAAEGVHT